MRKINYLLSFVTLGVTVMSCQKEDLDSNMIKDSGQKVTITASKASPSTDSKSSIDNLTFSWIPGDNLSLYGPSKVNENKKFATIETGKKVSFTTTETLGDVGVEGEHLYVTYPYNATNNFRTDAHQIKKQGYSSFIDVPANSYKFDLPLSQEQNYIDGAIDPKSVGKYAYMYGKTKEPWKNTPEISLGMQHVMAFFDFNITGIKQGTVIKSVTFNMPLPTETWVNIGDDGKLTGTQEERSSVDIEVALMTNGVAGFTTTGTENDPFKVRVATIARKFIGAGRITMTIKDMSDNVIYTQVEAIDPISGNVGDDDAVYPTTLPGKRYSVDIKYTPPPVINVTVTAPGQLESKVLEQYDLATALTAAELRVQGSGVALDVKDFYFIQRLLQAVKIDISATATTIIPQVPTSISGNTKGVFENYSGDRNALKTVILPNTITEIGDRAFIRTQITSLTLPTELTKIGVSAFHEAGVGLESISFPASLRHIGDDGTSAFHDSKLKTITIPEGAWGIYTNTFQDCKNLTEITLPSTLVYAGYDIFRGCSKITEITIMGIPFGDRTEPSGYQDFWNKPAIGFSVSMLGYINGLEIIYVEAEYVETFKAYFTSKGGNLATHSSKIKAIGEAPNE